eukprot:3761627-Amphidinium_carterae.1
MEGTNTIEALIWVKQSPLLGKEEGVTAMPVRGHSDIAVRMTPGRVLVWVVMLVLCACCAYACCYHHAEVKTFYARREQHRT